MGYHIKRPGNAINRWNESGVTLLEAVAALGIIVILLAVLAQLLETGSRLWLKNDRAYQRQHRLRDLNLTLTQDLSQAYASDLLPDRALTGDAATLALWRETPRGLQQVTYRYDSPTATLYRSAAFWGEQGDEQAVFSDIVKWKFEYFAANSRSWEYQWEPQSQAELPALIRITATTARNDLGSQVIAVEAWHDEAEN
jgi:type II secretory pathway component PulJ